MYNHLRNIFSLLLLLAGIAALAQDEVNVQDTLIVSQVNKTSLDDDAFLPIREVRIIEEKKVPQKKIDSLKNEEAYWYANLVPVKKKEAGNQSGINNLLWILIVVSFIAVVIWYLASSNLQLFRQTPEKILEEEQSEITEDIFMVNYDKEIAKAVDTKNYRLAVRLWYLRTLKELSQRNIINYGHEKTNSDYLAGLSGSRYYPDFFRLTRNFEYTWYGGFPLSEEGFIMMQKDFAGFKSSLPS
ncbi:MAG: hypothetical protein JWR72_118 [Flavisolibacter sp.]|nr:hypothetical protein [Flavisolibacter sp.]